VDIWVEALVSRYHSLELGGAWFWLPAMESMLKNAAGSQVEDDEDDAAALGQLKWC
jgi:hypothetical protein